VSASIPDLRHYLDLLRQRGDLVEIDAEVDPHLEAAEIHRRVIAAGGPALLFRNLRGHRMPVVSNLFGTAQRVEWAFGPGPKQLVERIAALPHELMPPTLGRVWRQRDLAGRLLRIGLRRARSAPVLEEIQSPPRASELPLLTTWERDGGPFITLPLVYTEHPSGPNLGAPNLGMYRMQRFDDRHFGMHWQIGKGGGFHHFEAERRGQPLPVNVFLGGPPALILAAIAPLPENVPELLLASLLSGGRLGLSTQPHGPLPVVARAEVALVGEVPPHERRPEGPFGDHYGYYSLVHDYPVFRCRALCRRRDAILPATVVGKPRQEDFYIGDFLQELLSPVFPLVMPGVVDLWSYGETGYHSLSAAVVKQRYKREAMSAAFRILGEGQLSLTKFLLIVDQSRDLRDFRSTLEHVLERCDPRTDLYVFGNLSMDTLDYNGPKVNEGSKGIMLGVGEPVRRLPAQFDGELPRSVRRAQTYCRGCLVLEGDSYAQAPQLARELVKEACFEDWPLLVLVDDAPRCARSDTNFLWTTFTRFEPAADIHAAEVELLRMHPSLRAPVLIDARLKPDFPAELFCDEQTARLVERRWSEYFPERRVEMGSSDHGHLDG
jgi:UbiD family decarboxylase